MFASVATGIVTAVLKKAVAYAGLKALGMIINIVSTFELIRSVHECREIGCFVELGYEFASEKTTSILIDEVVQNQFEVSQTASGLYVASQKPILALDGPLPDLDLWAANGFSQEFAENWQKARADFSSDLTDSRLAFLRQIEEGRQKL